MGLLVSPDTALRAGGFTFVNVEQRERRSGWLSFVVVATLHVAGLYGIATWTPRSEWLRLWKPVEVKLIQEEAPKPPEVEPLDEPPPPPKPEPVVRKSEPPPPAPLPVKVEETPPAAEPPLPVMTAAPSAPAVETPAYAVAPQPEAPPTPPPAPTVQPAAPPAPRTVTRIEYVRGPAPAYPLLSRRLGEQGKVMIKALVDEHGRALDAVVQQSSGRPRLDDAARKAVMEALFKPYREDGKAERVYVVVPVIFKLEG